MDAAEYRHTHDKRITLIRTDNRANMRTPNLAALWLAEWEYRRYPGRHRLLIEALGDRHVTRRAILKWRDGTNGMPSWAARAWAAAIERRCNAGLDLVVELRRHADAVDRRPCPGQRLLGARRIKKMGW